MIQGAKIIGTGLATTGLIGAGVGIGVVFGVTDLFALMTAFFVYYMLLKLLVYFL
jgi:hypothetical protein